jgi:ribosomal protein S27E
LIVLNDKGLRTLYPVGPDGNPITTQPGVVADLDIGIYVAGAGVAAAFVGSVMLFQSAKQALDASDEELADSSGPQRGQAPTKKCPDCAETILADAKVCKHCGYRFTPASAPKAPPKATSTPTSAPKAPPKQPSGKSTKVKCGHCEHLQTVPVSQQSFVCEECGTKLKRRTPVKDS